MTKAIDLALLEIEVQALTPMAAGYHMESCIMCMNEAAHVSGVELQVSFEAQAESVSILWPGTVTPAMHRTYADINKRIDYGACAIALPLIQGFTDLRVLEQSPTGTRIDYYLTRPDEDDDLIFNTAAYLEVSGIQQESSTNTVDYRIQSKLKRLQKQSGAAASATPELTTYICVVEFSRPAAKVVIS